MESPGAWGGAAGEGCCGSLRPARDFRRASLPTAAPPLRQDSSLLGDFAPLASDVPLSLGWADAAFGLLPASLNFWMGAEPPRRERHSHHPQTSRGLGAAQT